MATCDLSHSNAWAFCQVGTTEGTCGNPNIGFNATAQEKTGVRAARQPLSLDDGEENWFSDEKKKVPSLQRAQTESLVLRDCLADGGKEIHISHEALSGWK